jgi:DNA-binding CsgD family transcriptional regulator
MAGPTEAQFIALCGALNDVALGHGDWNDILFGVAEAVSAPLSTLELIDKRNGGFRALCSGTISDAETREYEERVRGLNPRFSLLNGARPGQVRTDHDVRRDLIESSGEYFDWLGRATETRHFAGTMLFDDADFAVVNSVCFAEGRDPITAAEEQFLERFIPCMANALKVQQSLAGRPDALELLDDVSLQQGAAFALLDARGRIIEMSQSFERIVQESDGLSVINRRLAARRAADRRRIERLLADVSHAGAALMPVRIAPAGWGQGLLLRAIRLRAGREFFERLYPAALLVVTDLDAPVGVQTAELSALWGLTEREAELAVALAQGGTLDQAARRLGMSTSTARYHLKSIFRRMEIDRQADLVRLVGRVGGGP